MTKLGQRSDLVCRPTTRANVLQDFPVCDRAITRSLCNNEGIARARALATQSFSTAWKSLENFFGLRHTSCADFSLMQRFGFVRLAARTTSGYIEAWNKRLRVPRKVVRFLERLQNINFDYKLKKVPKYLISLFFPSNHCSLEITTDSWVHFGVFSLQNHLYRKRGRGKQWHYYARLISHAIFFFCFFFFGTSLEKSL